MYPNPHARGWRPEAIPQQRPAPAEETPAVDLPRVPAPSAPLAVGDAIRRDVSALLPPGQRDQLDSRAEVGDRATEWRGDAHPGGPGSGYFGRPTYVQGEPVWAWYGKLTGRWWAFVPKESRLRRRGDLLVEACTPEALRREVERVLLEAGA
jgi:hypothetical protein